MSSIEEPAKHETIDTVRSEPEEIIEIATVSTEWKPSVEADALDDSCTEKMFNMY